MKLFRKGIPQQPDEQEIIERIRANDRSVLGEIFIQYEKMVFTYIKTHGGGEADAEDILQESIIVLWQNAVSDKFELASKIGTYVMGIAKNKWRTELRKRKRLAGDEAMDSYAVDDNSAIEQVLEKEKATIIQQALGAINPVCKKLLLLFYFEQRNLADIAKILNFANPNVVKSKKYQCKKAFEQELKKSKVI